MTKITYANPELIDVFEEYVNGNKFAKKGKEYENLLKLYDLHDVKSPKAGEMVSSKYSGQIGDQFIFSVKGFKDDVRIDARASEAKYLKNTKIGDMIDVIVVSVDEENYMIKGSISVLYENRAHLTLKSLEEGRSVKAYIKSINPAGYDIDVLYEGVTLPGFMPNTLAGINRLHDSSSIVGQTFDVMIESFSREEGTYIVSRRRYLQTLIPTAIKKLEHGEVYSGHVTGTTTFGVFVEFNECLTGMIHKANVNPEWQHKLTSIQPGFKIEFYVKEVIKDKIILTQILRETLWDNIKNGQVITGKVRDTKPFGTLVNLDDETVGLIHTSEMEKMGKKFQEGQEIKVKVLSVDRQSRKIFLTIG